MKLASCITWDNTTFDAVPFRGNFVAHATRSKEIGFEGIELAIRDPKVIDTSVIIETLDSLQLELCAIGTGQAWGEDGLSFTHPDKAIRHQAVERVKSHVLLAQETGATIIIGLLRGVLQADTVMSQEKATQVMYECFSECCEVASKYNIDIAFEPINRYETSFINNVDEGLELIHKIGGNNLGLLLDTFHMNIEEANITQSIKHAGNNIFHVHYADSNRLYPGQGHIDFKSIINTLQTIGYEGYLSGEHKWLPNPDTAVTRAYAYMSSLLQ